MLQQRRTADTSWQVPVTGLTCSGCVRSLEQALEKRREIRSAKVNLALSTVAVAFTELRDAASLARWLEDAGFAAKTEITHYSIPQAHCASCIKAIETASMTVPVVINARFNLALSELRIEAIEGLLAVDELTAALQAVGYSLAAKPAADADRACLGAPESSQVPWPLWVGILLAAPMVMAMLAHLAGISITIPPTVQWLLTTPIQFWLGAHLYRSALSGLRNARVTMEVLVVLGTTTAYGYSLYLWVGGYAGDLYFEAAAVIIVLVLLGRHVEGRVKSSTSRAIRQLLNLQPKTANLWRDGAITQVPVATLKSGDEIQVLAGQAITVDGRVIDGESDVDESMLTGERMPVLKTAGATVLAGTLVIDGSLRIKTEKTAADSRLQQITQLVGRALAEKSQVQRAVDQLAAVFVPTILLLATLTLCVQWLLQDFAFAVMAAVSVLIIACPCALGLATPMAVVAASGAGARRGILIRDVDQLAKIARLKHCVFDKTGTLTSGKLRIVNEQFWHADSELTRRAVLALESFSKHPIAQAIGLSLRSYQSAAVVTGVRSHAGKGLVGNVDEVPYAIGNVALMSAVGIECDAVQHRVSDPKATQAWIAAKFDGDYQLMGLLELRDAIKPQAPELIHWLKQRSITPWLLSGDAAAAATQIAEDLNIAKVQGRLSPERKLAIIEEIRKQSRHHSTVLMVGDGINDAPALAAADASIAVGDGTDIAIETAGITLMRPDIGLVAEAIQLAGKAVMKIKQNLFWAFIYNLIAIPLAAMGLLNPMVAGAAMALSSISVIVNSMLLLQWQPQPIGCGLAVAKART